MLKKLLRWAVQKEIPHATFIAFYFAVIMWMLFEDFYAVKLYFAVSVLLYILYAVVSTIYSFVKKALKKWKEKRMERRWRERLINSWRAHLPRG